MLRLAFRRTAETAARATVLAGHRRCRCNAASGCSASYVRGVVKVEVVLEREERTAAVCDSGAAVQIDRSVVDVGGGGGGRGFGR